MLILRDVLCVNKSKYILGADIIYKNQNNLQEEMNETGHGGNVRRNSLFC